MGKGCLEAGGKPDELYRRIDAFIRKTGMLEDTDLVLAGVSGGADSVFLFYLLLAMREKYGYELRVMHLHHEIRGREADRDADYVCELCEKNEVPVYIVRRDIPAEAKQSGRTLEEAGRIARYEEFARLREKLLAEADGESVLQPDKEKGYSGKFAGIMPTGAIGRSEGAGSRKKGKACGGIQAARHVRVKVALAHHQNDAAETLIFNLARGTGVEGLSSIRPVRDFYIRPLLAVTRGEITGWLTAHGISWCEDSTNADDGAARNRIRHTVIPALENGVNPAAVRHMAGSAERCAEAADFIHAEAAARAEQYICFLSAEEEKITGNRKMQAAAHTEKTEEASGKMQAAAHTEKTEEASGKMQAAAPAEKTEEEPGKMETISGGRKDSGHNLRTDSECGGENLQNPPEEIAVSREICGEMKIMQDEILRLALREISGSLTDLHSIHIGSLEALFDKANGAHLDLPRGICADRTAEGIVIHRKIPQDERTKQEADGAEAVYLTPASDGKEALTGRSGDPSCAPVRFGGFSFSGKVIENRGQDIPEKTYTKWFDYDKIKFVPVAVRHRRQGDHLTINDSGGRKSLSDYLTNEKIPRDRRGSLVLLADGSEIMWVVGMRIGYRYRVTAETKRILEVSAVRDA